MNASISCGCTANPTPSKSLTLKVVMPTAFPLMFMSGPPLFPGFTETSVCT